MVRLVFWDAHYDVIVKVEHMNYDEYINIFYFKSVYTHQKKFSNTSACWITRNKQLSEWS